MAEGLNAVGDAEGQTFQPLGAFKSSVLHQSSTLRIDPTPSSLQWGMGSFPAAPQMYRPPSKNLDGAWRAMICYGLDANDASGQPFALVSGCEVF